jgi:hypothetical protein
VSRPPPPGPKIASSLVNALRRQLLESGAWAAIEADIRQGAPELVPWLSAAERDEWVPLDGHLRMMDILEERVGDGALASLGHQRLREATEQGPLAPLLRSWVREYGSDPVAFMRVLPHAWHAATRDAGRMVMIDAKPGRVAYRIEGAPASLLRTRSWHTLLAGFGAELLSMTKRQGSFSIVPSDEGLLVEASWEP